MNAKRTPTNTRRSAVSNTIKTSSLAGLSTWKLAKLVYFSAPAAAGFIDCTNYKHALAEERGRRAGWCGAVACAIIINAVFVAAFGAKIAAFCEALAQ